MHQNRAAQTQLEQMPMTVAERLRADPMFLEIAASVHVETHDPQAALKELGAVRSYYWARQQAVPLPIELERGWVLIAAGQDEAIAAALVELVRRDDLTPEEQRQLQKLWVSWSISKAQRLQRAGGPA